ncbi:WD repeat domain-containing protein [Xylariaceae sp. FL0255]|nr:WD repeat domain-containing protein [Xylariaceae sp. FL0255]
MAQYSNAKLLDRPEPGLIKWSPTSSQDSFLHVNLQHRVVQLYKPTGHARRGRFDYEKVATLDDIPPLSTYDWSPAYPGFVAIGTASGTVNLLNLNNNANHYLEQRLKFTRFCQAIAFNTSTLLAVGLERVRNDQCLQIWDINRLAAVDSSTSWSSLDGSILGDPVHRLEPATTVSSTKFFEDSPQTLVIGIKNHGIRIYDLRDPHGAVINYSTRCNNNLAIDYADPNYFASSSLDRPGIVIWDRRATGRSSASPAYLDAVDNDGIPWGAALSLDTAIDINSSNVPERGSLVRSIRFCRDHRGLLAVLSRTGQLRALDTRKEFIAPEKHYDGSPELLETRKSYELDMGFAKDERKHDQIVSFDWVTLDSPTLTPRALVLRTSGAYEILEKPSYTTEHVYKMVPWQAPYRGLEEGTSYHDLMEFDMAQCPEMMTSLLIDHELKEMPLFGDEDKSLTDTISQIIQAIPTEQSPSLYDGEVNNPSQAFLEATTPAEKLRAIKIEAISKIAIQDGSFLNFSLRSYRESHELSMTIVRSQLDTKWQPTQAQVVLDHIMLLRAKEKYLFDYGHNLDVVADDPWLQGVWCWVDGASKAVYDDGMICHGIDCSYLGVIPLWTNNLGRHGASRLMGGTPRPDDAAWERCLQGLEAKSEEPSFECKTKKPGPRQVAMRVCQWGKRPPEAEPAEYRKIVHADKNYTLYTRLAAHELFEGKSAEAVKILKDGSAEYPELLFVSLALQLTERGQKDLAMQQLDFDPAAATKTDPYLRAISSYLATGDWETIANQESLPLRERTYVALRYLDDEKLTPWLEKELKTAIETGDIEGIVLTGITDDLVDIFAKYIEKFNDIQTATLILSICAPRYIDDYRCTVWRNAYRAYLQRYKAFLQRTKFEVESTKKSKHHGGRPLIKPPSRQIALRCVYCDAEYELAKTASSSGVAGPSTSAAGGGGSSGASGQQLNPLMATSIHAGVSCPNCGRHLPRCVVCLEVVGIPRSDKPEASPDPQVRLAARFPTFCLKCDHVLHLDHARLWFARHTECPVPECRCRCNFRANPELNYK